MVQLDLIGGGNVITANFYKKPPLSGRTVIDAWVVDGQEVESVASRIGQ